jgi:hypothetical protein
VKRCAKRCRGGAVAKRKASESVLTCATTASSKRTERPGAQGAYHETHLLTATRLPAQCSSLRSCLGQTKQTKQNKKKMIPVKVNVLINILKLTFFCFIFTNNDNHHTNDRV